MKGVILAGGQGTRLRPMTSIINKHLLPIGNYPMIYYPVMKLKNAGVRDIMVILGKPSAGLYMEFLGGGEEWGVRFTYRIQSEPGGIAQGLLLAEGFAGPGEKLVVLLGDNLFSNSLDPFIQAFQKRSSGAMVLLKEVDDPSRYGVPVFRGKGISRIEEKPREPQSRYCVTGIYMYDSSVFGRIRQIKPSARGEMEITDVNNLYAAEGSLDFDILPGWWIDAGTLPSLYEASGKMIGGELDV